MKDSIVKERSIMLRKFILRNLSHSTTDQICKIFGNIDEKDQKTREYLAKKITGIIDSSETEEEIMEKLNSL